MIDGALSEELADYSELDQSIKKALKRAHASGQIAARRYGNDPCQEQVAREFIGQRYLDPANWDIELTGAWMTQELGSFAPFWRFSRRLALTRKSD